MKKLSEDQRKVKAALDAATSAISTANCLSFMDEAALLYDIPPLKSPAKPGRGSQQVETLTRALFPKGSLICVTPDLYQSQLIRTPAVSLPQYQSKRGIYFKVNALVVDQPTGAKGGVRDADCGHSLMMLEMDKAPQDAQEAFWTAAIGLGLPVVSLVSSGGKSLHAILRLDALDRPEYNRRALELLTMLAPMVPDPTSINPSRYTRMPGCIRENQNDAVQEMIYFNPDAGVWDSDLPCNDVIRSITASLQPPPEKLANKLRDASKRVWERSEWSDAETREFKKWRRGFRFSGQLHPAELIADLGWASAAPLDTPTEVKYYIGCPWSHEHTGAGQSDGPTDAYLYERKTNARFKWGFHCSHDACQTAQRHVTNFFDLVRNEHPEELESAQHPWPDVTAGFEELPEEDEKTGEPIERTEDDEDEDIIEGSGTLLAGSATEVSNSDLFEKMHHRRVRYVHDEEVWRIWQHGRWQADQYEEIREKAKEVTRLRVRNTDSIELQEAALRLGTSKAVDGLLKSVRSLPKLRAISEDFDVNPWLFGCKNGILDLRTAKLYLARPGDMMASRANVNYIPEATCPRWMQHLSEIHPGRPEVSEFLQVWFGYMLTGMVCEEKMVIFYGSGRNGKSTLVDTFHSLMGDYAGVAAKSLLLASPKGEDPSAATPALVDLKGKRMVSLSETNIEAKISEAAIKECMKSEPITARKLFGNPITFRSKAKIIFSSNHRPRIQGTDEGIWRRLVLVKFMENFEGREDKTLKEVVASEWEGIFAWAVQGCLKWQERGLVIPRCIQVDTAAYRKEEDVMSIFLDDNVNEGPDLRTDRKDAYARYTAWVRESGLKPLSRPNFNRKLIDKGFRSVKAGGYEHWVGFSLKEEVLL